MVSEIQENHSGLEGSRGGDEAVRALKERERERDSEGCVCLMAKEAEGPEKRGW